MLQKITTYLSDELNTEVTIDRIDIDFFDKLVMEGFILKDLKGDTLLYAGNLKAGFNTNLISLLRGRLQITSLYLENA